MSGFQSSRVVFLQVVDVVSYMMQQVWDAREEWMQNVTWNDAARVQDAVWLHAIDFNLRCLWYREIWNNFLNLNSEIKIGNVIVNINLELMKFKFKIAYEVYFKFGFEKFEFKWILEI